MTQFLLLRHAEPDYTEIDKRKYRAFGNDLAPLTEKGIQQAIDVSKNALLQDIDIIISSPYTRTLETAAIISRELNKKLKVELDLMEWIPDKTYMYNDHSKVVAWCNIYEANDGKHLSSDDNWEEKHEIISRVNNVLKNYKNYSKVLIVTHGIVMSALTGIVKPNCTEIIEYNFKN